MAELIIVSLSLSPSLLLLDFLPEFLLVLSLKGALMSRLQFGYGAQELVGGYRCLMSATPLIQCHS
jgi:hypothetical protein